MKPIAMALCLSVVGLVPAAANAAQIRTNVSTPHVNVRTNVSTPNVSSGTPTAKGAGKVSVHDLHITKTVDKSSPNLYSLSASGKHIPKATLTTR